jgi:hypothetical protein
MLFIGLLLGWIIVYLWKKNSKSELEELKKILDELEKGSK